jgi:phytoene desaturase
VARIVVIGAGFGGLAAASRLSALGHDVTVCEQAQQVGGKLGTYARDGFRFDTGPSLLTMPAVFAELFAATGDPLRQVVDLQRLDPHCRYHFADGTRLDTCADRADLTTSMQQAFGGSAGADWERLLDRAGGIWQASRGPFVESPGPPRLLPLARRRPRDLPVVAPGRSLRWIGSRYLSDLRQRALLERYATYSGSDPRRAPAALASTAFVEQEYGCWYVGGGLYRLAEVLADRLPRGAIRLQTPVAGIELDGGRVSGVRLAGASTSRLNADAVVADVDAGQLYAQLLGRPALAPRGTPSSAGFVLLLGLRGRPPDLAHHTVFFPPLAAGGYAAEFDAIFAGRLAPAPTIYVSAPVDPAVAPGGDTAAFVLVNAPVQGRFDWDVPDVAARYAQRVLAVLAERGLDLRGRLRFCEVRTPADLARSTWSPGGAIHGLASHGARAAFRRAANRSPVPGLFLTGGSAHPGGGLPLVAMSARAVAGLIGPA